MNPAWFAIWTRSRHEKLVRDQLAKKTDVDVFLPTIGKWSRWKDRKKKIDWPLFPGYVFARFVADERIGILKVDGVVQIIKIEALRESTTKSFEDAKNDIADKIANGKRQGEMLKFIAKLRAEAIIDWKNDEIKKAYEVGLKQEAEQTPPSQPQQK